MKYLSTFSGIEAATVAWHPLGWEPVGFSEIEPFPCAVLKHHYPNTPNYGDITQFRTWSVEPFQLLVGGSPCQSFSVAGLRKGLADERGNLMLEFGRLAEHYRPTWVVWENVPGVLSSNGGRDFASFLGMLAEFGYGFAYRVLDAQYFGVPQRRRRVFVVGYLGDWRPAAAVLFDPHSLSGHPPPSRKAGQGTAGGVKDGIGEYRSCTGLDTAPCVTSKWKTGYGGPSGSNETGNMVYNAYPMTAFGEYADDGKASALKARDYKDATDLVTQPVTYDMQQVTAPVNKQSRKSGDPCHTLSSDNAGNDALVQPIGVDLYNQCITGDVFQTVSTRINASTTGAIMQQMAVRRLTPVECERLQGFPDGYTAIPWKNKPVEQCPDGPRYKALGNSMAVPVMRWIGERIQAVEDMMKELKG
jgi:DNA (cytosine-5)-methyltransferase 1